MAKITVHSFVPNTQTFSLPSSEAHQVDDLTQKLCEFNRIPPLFRYLTALYDLKTKAFLSPHETIGADGRSYNLQLRVRFHPVVIERLFEAVTLNFYYHQLRYYLLNELKENSPDTVGELLALFVVDYVRQLIEKEEEPSPAKSAEFLRSTKFPASWKFPWWKKKIFKQSFVQSVNLCYWNTPHNVTIVKYNFIETVWELREGSRQELFQAYVITNEVLCPAEVVIGHLVFSASDAKTGPQLTIKQNVARTSIHPIAQIFYLSILDEQSVRVHVRDEQPITMVFEKSKLHEFVALVDGYFRMTECFTAYLCGRAEVPSIAALKKHRIHGPITSTLSIEKLWENKKRQGCFLVRQSQTYYRVYYVDIILADGRFEFHTILESEKGGYTLAGDPTNEVFTAIEDLLSARLPQCDKLTQLPPAYYDKTGLQFCRKVSEDDLKKDDRDAHSRIIDVGQFRPEFPHLRCNAEQMVIKGTYEDRRVVFRLLRDDSLLKDFMRIADEAQSWKCRYIVPIVGIALRPQMCLVSEYMPLGSLDTYLRNFGRELSARDRGDACLCLGKAVWYLEENGFVHGKIRCRSLFVVDRSTNSFRVKLGEPGLPLSSHNDAVGNHDHSDGDDYNNANMIWIAPECRSGANSVAYAQKADLYAMGTTFWEIFNNARDPYDVVATNEAASEFFASGGRLPLTGVPQEFRAIIADCWNDDPRRRRSSRLIVRDIHQILRRVRRACIVHDQTQTRDLDETLSAAARNSHHLTSLLNGAPSPRSLQLKAGFPPATTVSSVRRSSCWRGSKWLKLIFRTGGKYDSLSNSSQLEAPLESEVARANLNDGWPMLDDTQPEVDNARPNAQPREQPVEHQWYIRREDVEIGEPLAQGFFGVLFKAKLTRRFETVVEDVAAKLVKSSLAESSQLDDVWREFEIMKQLRHDNIVQMRGIVVAQPEVFLVMEYAEMGTLLKHLRRDKRKRERRLTHRHLTRYGCDVANAMAYIEQKRIVHRDLAARNILVKTEFCVKIGDFGRACFDNDGDTDKNIDYDNNNHCCKSNHCVINSNHCVNNNLCENSNDCLTPTMDRYAPFEWHAPESVLYGKFSSKSDVWSYGVTLWEVFSYGDEPKLIEIEHPVVFGEALIGGHRLPRPEQCSAEIYEIMRDCWMSRDSDRPTFAKLHRSMQVLLDAST